MSGPAAPSGDLPSPEFMRTADGNRLLFLLRPAGASGAVVQMVAARSGEGTSTLARDLALIAARTPGWRVLLLDLDPPGQRQADWLRARYRPTAAGQAIVSQRMPGVSADMMVHRLGGHGLHVSELRGAWPAGAVNWTGVLSVLRASFELVLVDSPALERSFDCVMLAKDVDTSLLVVEAEATRTAVAQNLRDRILEVGGMIAGTVLNKRRFHIPAPIYERI
ncbi:MAG: hypothetical protein JO264_00265 [Acidisphaera sp.]|nr:hypothetical protein [Acidisphaera sp.]